MSTRVGVRSRKSQDISSSNLAGATLLRYPTDKFQPDLCNLLYRIATPVDENSCHY